MSPALVAMTRMVAARMPTQTPRMPRSHARLSGMKRTTPCTGSSMKLLPSCVPYSRVYSTPPRV